jgi:hypothetical protein
MYQPFFRKFGLTIKEDPHGNVDAPELPAILAAAQNSQMKCSNTTKLGPISDDDELP